jgi:nucleoside-diphosphate-sugar epimerase
MTEPLHLVAGGSGYFGSLLVRKLRAAGLPVRVFDLVDADDRPADVEFVQGNILDAASIGRACQGAAYVYHNVAELALSKDKAMLHAVNVVGTENLLQAARAAKARKVVYTSTSAVYGNPERNPVTEAMTPVPQEAYGRAKRDGELACLRFAQEGGSVAILRPCPILGHGRLGIFQLIFEWIRQGSNIPVLGSGNNRFQFVHADDLADACMLAARRAGSAVYNCGAERFGTMRETLEALCRFAGTGSRVRSIPFWPAVAAMKVTSALGLSPLGSYHALMYGRPMYFDIGLARRELGWSPRYSNDEMLISSYSWYLEHREQVLNSPYASVHRSAVKQGVLALIPRLL